MEREDRLIPPPTLDNAPRSSLSLGVGDLALLHESDQVEEMLLVTRGRRKR
jgi:hypothetical protein